MSNPGTAVPRAEELFLEQLEGRADMADVRLLDRDPATGRELATESGVLDTLWISDVDADLVDHGGHAGTVPYDETATFTIVIQVIRRRGPEHPMVQVKRRAADILDAVIAAVALVPHLANADVDKHARFEFLLDGYKRSSGILPGGTHVGCRYTIRAELRARITPTS